ncbi:MAG TPA: penicillin-binding protein 2 [Acidimicrobiales bacterium]|nr:penicillin-binding protein 2 [Acidimicrobiales bacterium]
MVRPSSTSTGRLGVIGLMVACLFAAMFVRLWYLQVLESPQLAAAANSNQTRQVTEAAPRGLILDRNGNVIVGDRTVVAITVARSVVPTASCGGKLPSQYPAVIGRLADLLGLTTSAVLTTLSDCRYSPYEPVPVATNVDISKVVYLREHQSEFPGVSVQELSQRYYPAGTAAAQVLGYVGPINSSQLNRLKNQGYQQGDLIGQAGVEAAYESSLRGKPGVTDLEVNAGGRVLGTLSSTAPVPGDDVQLSIDLNLQKTVDADLATEIKTLHNQRDPLTGYYYPAPSGAAVVLDPTNGQVLAMSSYPSYDPSVWVGGISTSEYAQLAPSDPNQPDALINRAVTGTYTPGSTFKLVTATAALDDGLINPGYYYDDTGSFTIHNCTAGCTFHNNESEALGSIDVQTALTASDDVFFYNLGYMFYENQARYGPQPIQTVAKDYGMGQPTGFDLYSGAGATRVDSPAERIKLHDEAPAAFPNYQWYAGDNIEMAFGQGATVISPLQLADAYATFANGGTLYAPHVGAQIVTPEGKVVQTLPGKVMSRVTLPPATKDTILAGLEGVVSDRLGTAYGTFLGFPDGTFPVAAKTGTASTNKLEPTALFVSFAPADAPRYVVMVVIDQAGYGASGAAPVARQVLQYLYQHPIVPVKAPSPGH